MPLWKRVLIRIVAALVLAGGLLYAGDYISLRFGIPPGRQKYSTVHVQPYYLIHEKNGKLEYDYSPPEDDTCVISIFPHFGFEPCWYLSRHPERKIEI